MSGLIPYDALTLGKALYVIERKADFLNGTVDANVIPTVTGQASSAVEQSLTMKNSVLSGGVYTGGFETISFAMRNESGASKDVVMAASLTLNSLMASTPVQQTLAFTDGTNSIKIYSANTTMLSTNTSVQMIFTFVAYMVWAYENKCGYIMGSYGQAPKGWSKSSWRFTQYKGSQREKALYWREHAPLVMDCNGIAEGCYLQETGVNINARARNNYASWCTNKGLGRIPAKLRVPDAAVFVHNGSYISHVGYLWKPVVADKPEGDWWVIEARGVMYGVVKTRLYARGWNRYGWMTKYYDYRCRRRTDRLPVGRAHPAIRLGGRGREGASNQAARVGL